MPFWLRDPRRHRAVFALALPMVFSNVTTPLLGLVDTWVIGHLGQAWFLGGVPGRGNPHQPPVLAARFPAYVHHWPDCPGPGRRQRRGTAGHPGTGARSRRRAGTGLAVAGAAFLASHHRAQRRIPEVQVYAGDYVSVRIWSAPAALCNLVIMGWLLGMQDARSPMLLLILSNLVNMVLDAWFVLGLGWQVRGWLPPPAGGLLLARGGALAGEPPPAPSPGRGVAERLAALVAMARGAAAARPESGHLHPLPLPAALFRLHDLAGGQVGGRGSSRQCGVAQLPDADLLRAGWLRLRGGSHGGARHRTAGQAGAA